jgi:hypothetical protein
MAESLTDRITAQLNSARGRMERATYQGEHDEWKRIIRLLEDIRDHLGKPVSPIVEQSAKAVEQYGRDQTAMAQAMNKATRHG